MDAFRIRTTPQAAESETRPAGSMLLGMSRSGLLPSRRPGAAVMAFSQAPAGAFHFALSPQVEPGLVSMISAG